MIQNVKKILAPVDFSAASMEAMRAAKEIAKDVDAEVHLMHVIAPHHTFIPLPLESNAEQTRELAREAAMVEQAEEELARIKKDEFGDSNKVFTYAVVGHPVQKLIDYAKEQTIDLIVMATHGRSGVNICWLVERPRKSCASHPARCWSSVAQRKVCHPMHHGSIAARSRGCATRVHWLAHFSQSDYRTYYTTMGGSPRSVH